MSAIGLAFLQVDQRALREAVGVGAPGKAERVHGAGDGARASAVHAGPGLPDAAAILWLIRGIAAESETADVE